MMNALKYMLVLALYNRFALKNKVTQLETRCAKKLGNVNIYFDVKNQYYEHCFAFSPRTCILLSFLCVLLDSLTSKT